MKDKINTGWKIKSQKCIFDANADEKVLSDEPVYIFDPCQR